MPFVEDTYKQTDDARYWLAYVPYFWLGGLFLDYFVNGGKLLAWDFAYSGLLFNMVITWMGAGFAADKIIVAAYANQRAFFNYAHNSTLGNYIGAFEMLNVIGLLTIGPLLAAFGGTFSSYNIWTDYNLIQDKNITLTKVMGFKYMLMLVLKGVSVWAAALAIGSSASDLLSFYDTYNVATENAHCDDDGTNCTTDSDGTSLLVDLIYHELASWGAVVFMLTLVYFSDEQFLYWTDLMKPQ